MSVSSYAADRMRKDEVRIQGGVEPPDFKIGAAAVLSLEGSAGPLLGFERPDPRGSLGSSRIELRNHPASGFGLFGGQLHVGGKFSDQRIDIIEESLRDPKTIGCDVVVGHGSFVIGNFAE